MTALLSTSTPAAPAPKGHYSQAIAAGGLVFVTCQLGTAPKDGVLVGGGVEAQAEQALANVRAILLAAGSSLDRVVRVCLMLTSMADLPTIGGVYGEAFGTWRPVRTTTQVGGLPGGALVGFEVTAMGGSDAQT
jgi:2-iminobutanoate/2-iminopropanoate deaminase